jgi:bifunctional oligoribonuclease and PAP phosphatase NrnA
MPSPARPELDASQRRAVEALRAGQRFVLAGHVKPDGDCIGAQAALAGTLTALGKQVWIYNPDPPEPQFDYLSREFRFRTFDGGALPEHDWTVLLDISELSRCGPLEPVLRAANSRKMVIDHHVHVGPVWWDEAFVDVGCAASGLLVRRIARALGVGLDRASALGVFTSLVTDTGWFKYSNTDAETLATAAELLELGLEPARIYGSIYQRQSAELPLALARGLARLCYHAERRLAVIDLPRAAPGESELVDSDLLLDILRSVEAVEVVLFLREAQAGTCKLSARSKTDYDVQRLAGRFGGGGHRKAAGATIQGSLSEVRERVVAAALEGFGAPAASGGRA